MLKKLILATALSAFAFAAAAATVNVSNKTVSIQFANGKTFAKDYSSSCVRGGIGVSSYNINGYERVEIYCATFTSLPYPPYYNVNKVLLETVYDR
jgi:hypothetical protein